VSALNTLHFENEKYHGTSPIKRVHTGKQIKVCKELWEFVNAVDVVMTATTVSIER